MSEELLRHCPVFAGLATDTLAAVAARDTTRRLARRQALFHQGEAAGIVERGRERVTICNPHGLVVVAEDLPPGGRGPP